MVTTYYCDLTGKNRLYNFSQFSCENCLVTSSNQNEYCDLTGKIQQGILDHFSSVLKDRKYEIYRSMRKVTFELDKCETGKAVVLILENQLKFGTSEIRQNS